MLERPFKIMLYLYNNEGSCAYAFDCNLCPLREANFDMCLVSKGYSAHDRYQFAKNWITQQIEEHPEYAMEVLL